MRHPKLYSEKLDNGEHKVIKVNGRGGRINVVYASPGRFDYKVYSTYDVKWKPFNRAPRDLQALARKIVQ